MTDSLNNGHPAPAPTTRSDVHAHDRQIADVRLGPVARWTTLAALLMIFFFGDGPVWDHPFNIDLAVWWSYAPIPVVVALILLAQRRLSLLTFGLNTMEITLSKFAITYIVATALWALSTRPPRLKNWPVWPKPIAEKVALEAPPPPTPWPAAEHFDLHVRVLSQNKAQADALVFIAKGLDAITWAPPSRVKHIDWPRHNSKMPLVVHPFQIISVRASDKKMHALQLLQGNVRSARPLLGDGRALIMRLDELNGEHLLRCAIHDEKANTLFVVHHPHHAFSDANGNVKLKDIPAVDKELRIDVWHAKVGLQSKFVQPAKGQQLQLQFAL